MGAIFWDLYPPLPCFQIDHDNLVPKVSLHPDPKPFLKSFFNFTFIFIILLLRLVTSTLLVVCSLASSFISDAFRLDRESKGVSAHSRA